MPDTYLANARAKAGTDENQSINSGVVDRASMQQADWNLCMTAAQ